MDTARAVSLQHRSNPTCRWLNRLLLHAGMATCVLAHVSGQEPSPTLRLEAAIVSKLPQFVEWPRSSVDARATVDVCVGAPDPFGSLLPELVEGTTVEGRRVVTRPVSRVEDLTGCQVLFLPARPAGPHPLLQRASALPILTIGDDLAFLDQGGIVGLRLVGGRVRFDIDVGAAQRVGLRVSSQVLSLALSVRGKAS